VKSIAVVAAILVLAISIAYYLTLSSQQKSLPFINPHDVAPEMVDSSLREKGHGHRIGKFQLIDEQNHTITDQIMDGKVVVVEYFFTTCGTICPKMNQQMQRVQAKFKNDDRFELLSYTVDPLNDTPKQLLEYAKNHGYTPGQWHFITGSKEALYRLARTSFFVLKPTEAENLGDAGNDFIHTNNFVLIDQQRQIRGYYDGTNSAEIDELMQDVEQLLNKN